jgi:hypothetical protein
MKKFFSWLKNLGSGSQEPVEDRLPYEIPEELTEKLAEWRESVEFQRLHNTLRESFIRFRSENIPHPDIDFMQQDASNGFIIDAYNLELSNAQCLMLMAHWKEKLHDEDYFDSMSDLRLKAKGKQQAAFYRHYLKPSKRKLGLSNQRYGNVEIVFYSVDAQPQHIKFQVNAYRDAKYDEAEDFGHLIFELTS